MGAHDHTPFLTADDLGMSSWRDPCISPGAPQTAISEGDHPLSASLLDVADLDSLDDARLRYARRMAADAVDHLIALMDAIDARTEDMEPQNEDGDPLDEGEHDTADAEPDLGWVTHPSGAIDFGIYADDREHDTADAEPSLGSLDRRVDQTAWAGGSHQDLEHEDEDDRTAPERHGMGFVRCGPDDHEDGDPGGSDDNGDHGIADADGLSEQWAGCRIGALPMSIGGYVA